LETGLSFSTCRPSELAHPSIQQQPPLSKQAPAPLRVLAMNRLWNGQPSAAERSGRVHVGDQIIKVQGRDVQAMRRSEIISFIGAAQRPVSITFKCVEYMVSLVMDSQICSFSQNNLVNLISRVVYLIPAPPHRGVFSILSSSGGLLSLPTPAQALLLSLEDSKR
jgi:hypothetical protein